MAFIVELREKSFSALEEELEEIRENMFNLRFQRAIGQLEDYSQLKKGRRDIAQMLTVLNGRRQAIDLAVNEPMLAEHLDGVAWQADAFFDGELGLHHVKFEDENGNLLATANVDLNTKRRRTREARSTRNAVRRVSNIEVN